MSTTILIAPFEGLLARSLASEARAAGGRIVFALRARPGASPTGAAGEGGVPEPLPAGEEGDCVSLGWNPVSHISASALCVGARAALDEIDLAVIVADPSMASVDLLAAPPGQAAAALEAACLGPALLARELVRRFEARRSGALLLVAPEAPAEAPLGPAAALAAGAFRGLGEGLFAAARDASWSAWGVLDAGPSPELAARFAWRLLEERKPAKAGRWLRFTGKPGVFGLF